MIDHTNRRVLDVLETREKTVLKAWLAANKASGLLAQLEEVTTDMCDGYTTAVREELGSRVRIVIDRFHVIKQFQDRLDRERCRLCRQLSKDSSEKAEQLKGTRWLWITHPANLSDDQRQELQRLKEQFPDLARLIEQRDALREIFEDEQIRTASVGKIHLKKWLAQSRALGLKALEPFYKTLENWLGKIANYFVTRSSNGRTEGFNRGLRTILWRAAGMTNFIHFRQRVLNAFG